MANYFDQFESPDGGGNFFDQFDEKPKRGLKEWSKIPAAAINAMPAQIAGMPVDFALNLANLARAGYGAATGSNTPLLNPQDYVGSSEYLLQKMRNAGIQVDNPLPETPLARMLYSGINTGANAAAFGRLPTPRTPVPVQPAPPSIAATALPAAASGVFGQAGADLSGNPAFGIAASMIPQAAGMAANVALRPTPPKTPEMRQAVQYADEIGMPLSRGQRTGAVVPQMFEKLFAAMPGSAGWYNRLETAQKAKVDQTVNRLTKGGAGKLIDDYGRNKVMQFDEQFFADMKAIKNKFEGLASRDSPEGALRTIDSYVGETKLNPLLGQVSERFKSSQGTDAALSRYREKLIAAGVPEEVTVRKAKYKPGDELPLTGDKGDFNNYWSLRSLYSGRAMKGDAADQAAYRAISDAFDNAAMRSLDRQGLDPSKLQDLRQTYGVEKVINKGIEVRPDGSETFDPKKVGAEIARRDVKNKNWANWLGSSGDELRQLGNLGQNIEPVPTSGVIENRMAAQAARGMGIGGLPASGNAFVNLLGGAGSLVAGLTGVPWAANRIMQSGMTPQLLSPYQSAAKIGTAATIADEQQRRKLWELGLAGP